MVVFFLFSASQQHGVDTRETLVNEGVDAGLVVRVVIDGDAGAVIANGSGTAEVVGTTTGVAVVWVVHVCRCVLECCPKVGDMKEKLW